MSVPPNIDKGQECSVLLQQFKGRNVLIALCVLMVILAGNLTFEHVVEIKDPTLYKSEFIRTRTNEYCNRPSEALLQGHEGKPISEDFVLISSALMIRHGARLSISRPPAFVNQSHSCTVNVATNSLQEKFLKEVLLNEDFIMNNVVGNFSKTDLLPTPCSQLSVTYDGIKQMLQVGQFLGKVYLNNQTDIGDQEIHILTTPFSRTFQSLLAFLYAFSPTNFKQLIQRKIGMSSTIYFCDSTLNTDPAFDSSCECEKTNFIRELRATFRNWDLKKQNILNLFYKLGINEEKITSVYNKSVKSHDKFNIGLYQGETILAETSPSRVWDWLTSEYICPMRSLPCLNNHDCLTEDAIEDLLHLVDINNVKMVRNYHYAEATSLVMYKFLKAMTGKFTSDHQIWRSNSTKTTLPSLWILSAHDITVGPLFIALGIPVQRKVPYSSRVIFELWVSRKDVDTPYFKMLLNGKIITKNLPFCTKKMCKLEAFKNFLKNNFLQRFGADDFEKACRKK